MRQKWKYLRLEMKSGFVCMTGVLLGFLGILSLLFFFLFGMQKLAEQKEEDNRIVMGVVLPASDRSMEPLVHLAGNMTSLKGICRLEVCTLSEAKRQIGDGRMQMLMVIPEGFYESANRMETASFELYAPATRSSTERKIIAMISSVEKVMVVTEGAITAMYKGMERYSFSFTRAEMEDALTRLYLGSFLSRESVYDVKFRSPYGEYSFLEYYGASFLLAALLLCLAAMFGLYSREQLYLESVLGRSRRAQVGMLLIKLWSILLPVFLLLWGIFFSIGKIGASTALIGEKGLVVKGAAVTAAFLIALSLSLFLHLFAVITAVNGGKQMYFLVIILMLLSSGGIVSRVYFPEGLKQISGCLPFSCWHSLLLEGMGGSLGSSTLQMLLLQDGILFAAGLFLYLRCMGKGAWR